MSNPKQEIKLDESWQELYDKIKPNTGCLNLEGAQRFQRAAIKELEKEYQKYFDSGDANKATRMKVAIEIIKNLKAK